MQKVLDLSKISSTNPFSIDNYTPKQTATGLNFRTYRGLRMYLITGSLEPAWLRATHQGDFDVLAQKQMPYVFVRDLKDILKGALQRDISNRPMIGLVANRNTEVHIGDKANSADLEWLGIVREVVEAL
ncbi:hypothetical protein [Pseudomonas phage D6]|nr:hypothetical protein [Pseudomonas phage D6]